MTQSDKMLMAVLSDEQLIRIGRYDSRDYTSLHQALQSQNYVVNAVAQIIESVHDRDDKASIYKRVNQYLQGIV